MKINNYDPHGRKGVSVCVRVWLEEKLLGDSLKSFFLDVET